MADSDYENKVLHELDGIKEYDNPMPGWLMAIWWGALLFSVAYVAFFALSFGEGSMESEYREQTEQSVASNQVYFDAHPLVPPSSAVLLAGARDPKVLAKGEARFAKTCAACHGAQAQGLIGPNLTDDRWIHGGKVEQVFQSVVKGWPAKGMPPWGRAVPPDEIAALVSYIRSVQGSNPANPKPPEGDQVAPEPLPAK